MSCLVLLIYMSSRPAFVRSFARLSLILFSLKNLDAQLDEIIFEGESIFFERIRQSSVCLGCFENLNLAVEPKNCPDLCSAQYLFLWC